jgi:hypothetical protein
MLLGAILMALLVGLVLIGVLNYGDEGPEEGLRVVNRTDRRILVYSEMGGDIEENLVTAIPSGSSVDTGLCGRIALVARRPDGGLIARRAPSESCAEEWVVREE